MIYIKDNIDMTRKSFFEKIRINVKGFNIKNIDSLDRKLIEIKNVSDKVLEKLSKYLNENCINSLCISNELLHNEKFMSFVEKKKLFYYDGKWLYKMLTEKILEYIVYLKREKFDELEVSFVVNSVDKNIVYLISSIAQKVKLVNIITEDERPFIKIKEKLFKEYGIVLNFGYGPKALLKSDIVLNYDFNEKEINKYIFPRKCVLINFKDDIKIKSKSFNGINVNGYNLNLSEKVIDVFKELQGFDKNLLYESYIYKNTLPENILKRISEDKIDVLNLCGIKGEIKRIEYLKNMKKMVNSLDKTEN